MELAKRVLKYLKPYKGRLVLGIICMLLNAAVSIFFFEQFGRFMDSIISSLYEHEAGMADLNLLIVVMFFIFFSRAIFYYGQKYLTAYVSQNVVKDLRNDLYYNLQNLSLDFYAEHKTGRIMSRVTNDVGILEGAIVSGAIGIFSYIFQVVGGVGKLFYDNWRLSAFAFILFPLIAYIIDYFNRRIRKVSKRAQVKIADVSDILQETISGVRVVKSFQREDYEYQRFEELNYSNFRANMKHSQLKAVLSPVTEFLAEISFVVVLWYGGRQVMIGHMSPGELTGFFTLLLYLTTPLRKLTKLSGTIQRALAAAERIFEFMDFEPTIKEHKDAQKIEQIEGTIEFEDINFSYDGDELALEGINLKVEPGQMVALVGPSGAGKSTLVNLVPRFYDPEAGQIKLDGIDIKNLKLDSLRDKIGIVPQETVLFGGTIKENILYGDLEASEQEVIKAAQAANAHKFILELAEGYETEIGERGSGLSGGQKQRIAIARAILKDPQILILDEATSALDTESEALVQEALDRLMQERTTFVIAHRLSTILDADQIVVMEEGRIVEVGTHQQLLEEDGVYRNLYEVQFNK
ncbi:ABC transporter ATP-binding protein [Natroniella sp. ANB-PHB2]|uniref:ABC transporter ATP-binding protein n=1 Tax=Natroniella sp. ANB-PHB2 TaxID=3384444 RepID=UPI0038D41A50